MAKKRRQSASSLNATAESIGAALGHVAARLDSWKKQRAEIAADIQKILRSAQGLLGDLGDVSVKMPTRVAASLGSESRKGGRPKGYKMSEETKKKLRAAWKRRKAATKSKVAE